jgi:Cu(I)/Ag(I) efflux system membrane protein CusA/SilA
LPICLAIIFFLLYLNFRSWLTVLNVFAAVPVCVAGGLILLWGYPWLQDLFHALGIAARPSPGPIHVTVAVVVGFIALFGIATDDGVVMATYLGQRFRRRKPQTVEQVREAVLAAGLRRARPCLMTTFTTILALAPILVSTGTGSDVAQPMAIPVVGGMLVGLFSLFIVPTVYCWVAEVRLRP